MTVARGRIVRASEAVARVAKGAGGSRAATGSIARGRVIKKDAADARTEARRIVAQAEEQERHLLEAAECAARDIKANAEKAGREDGAHRFAAAYLKLRQEQAMRDDRDLSRSIEIARAMAERLIGESLALSPGQVTSIARQALGNVRRVRSVAVFAHPDDAGILQQDVERLGLEGAAIEIHVDPARSRGSLLLRTDQGILDADLCLQLDRLTAALRDTFAEE
jgi:flagellar biosynthesis/type III secretory pathway protein FliH